MKFIGYLIYEKWVVLFYEGCIRIAVVKKFFAEHSELIINSTFEEVFGDVYGYC